jgi:MFS family permease
MEKCHGHTTSHTYGRADAHGLAEPLQVCWEEKDPQNPYSMSTSRKWAIVFLVASTTLCYTCTSSLYTSTYDQITVEFNCSEIVATLGLSLFIGGLGLGPMVLAPLSEFYGRKPIYVLSLLLFIVWIVPCAMANNIQTMLVARFVSGFVGAAFTSVAGGTVGDLFTKNTLLAPMMVYSASPLYAVSSECSNPLLIQAASEPVWVQS